MANNGQKHLRIKYQPLDKLIPYARNARTHSEAQVAQIAASIREFGWTNPVLVDAEGNVVAGHGRILAARVLDIAKVPTINLGDLTATQRRALLLADNKLALNAGWDDELLSLELSELKELGVDMELIGFDEGELADIFGNKEPVPEPEFDLEPPKKPETKPGDILELGPHRVMCGDSTKAEDVEKLMGGEIAVLMNTDPPYGIDYSKLKDGIPRSGFSDHQQQWGDIENDTLTDGAELQAFLEAAIRNAVPHLSETAAYYLWHPMLTQGTFFAAAAAADILIHRQIIWVKPGFVLTRSGMYHWRHELCFYGWRRGHKPPWYGNKSQTSVWELARDGDSGQHPTQKPIELFAIPMRNHTREGEAVYDPFTGSGSQVIAADQLGRVCYGMEIDPRYCDVIKRRYEAYQEAK